MLDQNGNRSGVDMSTQTYTLAEVAAELDCGTREVIRRCNGAVVRDVCGMRVLPGQVVRQLIEERDAKDAAYRERERQKRENPEPHPVRERIRARKARHAELDAAFNPHTGQVGATMADRARARVTADDSDSREQMQAADDRMDDFRSRQLVYRKGPGSRQGG